MSGSLSNTREEYGKIARWLHWTMATLLIIGLLAIYYRMWFTEPRTPPSTFVLQLHMSMGMSLFVFAILRLIWRLKNVQPDPVPGPAWQQNAARWTHRLFYVFLFMMPITGYIFAGLTNQFFYGTPLAFELLPKFSDTSTFQAVVVNGLGISEEAWRDAREPIKNLHVYGGRFVLLALIALHIGAALYHHFKLRDNTLKRMLG